MVEAVFCLRTAANSVIFELLDTSSSSSPVRTQDFHSCNMGSNPIEDATSKSPLSHSEKRAFLLNYKGKRRFLCRCFWEMWINVGLREMVAKW